MVPGGLSKNLQDYLAKDMKKKKKMCSMYWKKYSKCTVDLHIEHIFFMLKYCNKFLYLSTCLKHKNSFQ